MRIRFGTLLLSVAIALVLWGMAHGTSSIDRGVDIPVLFDGVPDDLVIVGQSVDKVNLRVLGSRAALRNVSSDRLEYRIEVGGAKPGHAVYEVDPSRIELPRGVRAVSRSPASIEVDFERRGRKTVGVRADLQGEVEPGFALGAVEVDPPRVWLAGARGEVMRLAEVTTEPIDLTGAQAPFERKVRLLLANEHVWPEQDGPVTVRIDVEPLPASADERASAARAPARPAGSR
ncbi:MAG TPA: CdaR family protein [Myxococcota bacterium]|nr:CdaR family protein [Myxococcota bacterium]